MADPYLLWRNAVLFCYAKVLEINCSIQQKLSFLLYSLYLEENPGMEKLPGNWTLLYEWKLLKKEIACNGLWLLPLPGCSEWVNKVKLQIYSQTTLSLIFPTWGKPVCRIQKLNFHVAEEWHWSHRSGARQYFCCNAGKKENSLKTAWIETSEALCFGLLPLLLKLGTSPIVLDFNRVRTISNSFRKNPTDYFQCMVLSSQKILVLESIVGFCNTQRWTPWFFHVIPTPSECPWVSSHCKSSAAADRWYCLLLIPPWQNVEEQHVKKSSSITSSSCNGCRSTGMGGSASCRMVPSFVLSSFSLLARTTVVPSCSRSWAFPGSLVM